VKEFKSKVAVITGAASGIGLALAERCATKDMKVVLADVEDKALEQAEQQLKAKGVSVLAVLTDVSKASDVEFLAQKTLDAFGAVHLLCNNAGVGGGAITWESTLADWEWVMGVNLWGTIHGVKTFVPIMLGQDTECHIVNTASAAALVSGPGAVIYKVTKHGIVSLTETLYHELAMKQSKIKVSVFCPWFVNTKIMECERNRPQEMRNEPNHDERVTASPEFQFVYQVLLEGVRSGMSCQKAADCVFDALREDRFYIFTDPGAVKRQVQLRMEDILQERNPTFSLL
jgi:NAD(P)-dependent dehydrogenase (short-subunit alcohol dehydrogenase family)